MKCVMSMCLATCALAALFACGDPAKSEGVTPEKSVPTEQSRSPVEKTSAPDSPQEESPSKVDDATATGGVTMLASLAATDVESTQKLYTVEPESIDKQFISLRMTLPEAVKVPADRLGGFVFDSIVDDTGRALDAENGPMMGVGHSAQWREMAASADGRTITTPAWIASPYRAAKTLSAKGHFNLLYWEGEQVIEVADLMTKKGQTIHKTDTLEIAISIASLDGFFVRVPKGQGYWIRDVIVIGGDGVAIPCDVRPEANGPEQRIYNITVMPVSGELPAGYSAKVVLAERVTLQPITFEIADAKIG